MESLNHSLFLALNAGSTPPAWLVLVATVAAKYVIVLVPLHLAVLWFGGSRAMRLVALSAGLALVLALSINQLIGLLAYSPRPFLIGLGHTLIEHRPSSSFPSNHATIFWTYAATLALYGLWRLAGAIACLGLLVAWSRIYLGIHFPFDMLGAAAVSGVAAVLSVQLTAVAERVAPEPLANLLALPLKARSGRR